MTQHPDPASVRKALHQMLEALLTVLDRNAAPFATMAAVDAAGKNFIERMSLSGAPAVQPAAQGVETNDYGPTDFGYTIIGPALEEGDKRLLSLLIKAFGNDHPAFDDLMSLILRSRSQPPAATQGEPDWDECIRLAEEATGLKVERHTMSIVIREVRRWLAASTPSPAAPTAPAAVGDEREAFEKWLLTVSHPTDGERLSASSAIEFARAAWLARAALSTAAVKAAEVPEPHEWWRQAWEHGILMETNDNELAARVKAHANRYVAELIAAAPAQGKAVE